MHTTILVRLAPSCNPKCQAAMVPYHDRRGFFRFKYRLQIPSCRSAPPHGTHEQLHQFGIERRSGQPLELLCRLRP